MKENKLILQTAFYGQQDTELSDTCFGETQSQKVVYDPRNKEFPKMIWSHEFIPTGLTSKPIVFSELGNQVIETIKNTEQNEDKLYKYNIDKHQESW